MMAKKLTKKSPVKPSNKSTPKEVEIVKNDLLVIPSAIQSFRTLVDGGIKLDVITSELKPAIAAKLMEFKGKTGVFVFSPVEINAQDIPDIDLDEEIGETKSPSQRLRNTLHVYWEKNTSQSTDFDIYYKQQMEKFINIIKDKI